MTITIMRDWSDPAGICRANGWTVGTFLVGGEGYGPTTILITAIGEKRILARAIAGPGSNGASESLWCLSCRNWQAVDFKEQIQGDASA